MANVRRKGPTLGARILARVEASDRARRRAATLSDASFEFDYGTASFAGLPGGRGDGDGDAETIGNWNYVARAADHVRTYGAYDMGGMVTRANQYPDRFGQNQVEFSYDGLGAEPPSKTVADVKRLIDVILYRVKVLEPAVYAVPSSRADQLAIRADFMRLKGRMMDGLELAQKAFVACAKSLTAADCDTPAAGAYDALVKAMRQGGSVDSPVQRGDYDDIVKRIKADGGNVDLSDAPEFGYEPPSFGDNIAGQKSIADLKDLLANWDAGMASMGNSFAAFSPQWVNIDPAAMADWSNDWAALQDRYSKARADAQSAIDASTSTLRDVLSLGVSGLVGDQAGAQSQYDEVLTAIKQQQVDGGGTITKGDYDDLALRLTNAQKAASAPVFVQQVVQPTASDPGLAVFNATQGVDVIGALTGQFHSPVLNQVGSWFGINSGQPGGPPSGSTAQTLVIIAALAIGGVFAFKLFVAPTVKAAVGLGAAVVGGYVGYKLVGAIASEASSLSSSPGAKLLGL